MSLLGRLEDLSLTDIVQIVFLSRRTGVLEIIDTRGRHTVLFRHGLVVNASSPEHPDLVSWLETNELVPASRVNVLRQMEESGIPPGAAAVEMNLISAEKLGDAVRARVQNVIAPLAQSREGEFNFILSEQVSAIDVEYDVDQVFKEGGLSPQRILGGDGEKLKPLRGLEESLKAGKALLRGSAGPDVTPASLNLDLSGGQALMPVSGAEGQARVPALHGDNVVQFPTPEEREEKTLPFTPVPDDEPLPEIPEEPPAPVTTKPSTSGQFKVAGGLIEVESPEATYRNVVLFERNPLIRVAARRAFGKKGVKIAQFGSLDDVRNAMSDFFASKSFFVTFLELTDADVNGPSVQLMIRLKRKNPRLPVVIVDAEGDLRRRHAILRAGADLYLTKPSPARLQPGLAEEELGLFADELVLFAERAFQQWEQFTGGGFGPEAGKRFYEQAQKETVERSYGVLKQLINELSNPNDIGQVSSTILRLSAEYLDRGALFVAEDSDFVGLGGFGTTGGGAAMDDRVKSLRIARGAPSLLADVATSGEPHRGKMRRTPTNVDLIDRLGGMLPTEVVALPIMHGNRAIGILYGDNAEHRAAIDSMTGLEIFLSQAGYAFGNAVFAAERASKR
ncbi:MAG TPA: response regulator [Thermoanaerobaculia bacterium]|nr:response regulator [Thermoanaerobaculia bacterium]